MTDTPVAPEPAPKGSDPWSDLALTLPIFIVYHLGVAFLPVKNAAESSPHHKMFFTTSSGSDHAPHTCAQRLLDNQGREWSAIDQRKLVRRRSGARAGSRAKSAGPRVTGRKLDAG